MMDRILIWIALVCLAAVLVFVSVGLVAYSDSGGL